MKAKLYKIGMSHGMVLVYHPDRAQPLAVREDEAARRIDAHDALLAAVRRLTQQAECTCPDGGDGFVCDVCEGRAAILRATG